MKTLFSLSLMYKRVFTLFLLFHSLYAEYKPDWQSLDSRPLPQWYDDSKFGIFMHWGVYSVPAIRSEWLWWYWKGPKPDKDVVHFIEQNYPPGTTYTDFAHEFHAELFNPETFREIVEASGAKYFVITSKHHEGFTMWPSKTSWNWNSIDVGPKRDILAALKKSFSKSKVHFGLYFSQFEWFNPLYQIDHAGNSTDYVDQVSYPQMLEIVNRYEPEVIWSDGDWDDTDEYWKSTKFLAWLYNESPVRDKIVVNDRWGKGTAGKHGGFMTYADHYDPGRLLPRKWENCLTLDTESWGNRRTMRSGDVRSSHEVIEQIARTISCGGNVLLNVGPDMHGVIPPIFEDRLREVGSFLKSNSEAVYGTKPWTFQNDSNNVWYTSRMRKDFLPADRIFNVQLEKDTIIYAWIIDVNRTSYELNNVKATKKTKISVLGNKASVSYSTNQDNRIVVDLSIIHWYELPRSDVIVLKIEYAQTNNHNPLDYLVEHHHFHNRQHKKHHHHRKHLS